MKPHLPLLVIILAMSINLSAQTSWNKFDRLFNDGSYKSAYELAEGVYHKSSASSDRLAAAWHMSLAASRYQEDAHDSAEARYRALLPTLDPLEKALCHAFLDEYDEALSYADVLKQTPVERIKPYCEGTVKNNVTPTAYDVVVLEARQSGTCTPQRRVELQRLLIDFHADDGDYIRIWNELQLLNLLEALPNHSVSLADYEECIDRYRGTRCHLYTSFYFRMASLCNSLGDYVAALRYCDSAINLFPKSDGGIACANLSNEIKQPRVSLDDGGCWLLPNQPNLQRVRYRNVDHLYYRVINYVEDYRWGDKTRQKLLASKVVESGEWVLECIADYQYGENLVALPALKVGHYLLLVSPSADFKAEGFMAYEMQCTEMQLVQYNQEGLLLDRRTGQPIVGQQLRLERSRYNQTPQLLATAITDRDGRYRFNYAESRWSDHVVVERGGFRLSTSYNYNHNINDSTLHLRAEVRTDRPIYKPGDTLQAAIVCYRTNGLEAEVAVGERLTVRFTDPNGEEIDTVQLLTDAYGVATLILPIPTDRLSGSYQLTMAGLFSQSVRVEEYKQPKFMVTLNSKSSEVLRFGSPCTVNGLAASYSAVPVGGARVQYTVKRRMLHRWWWRWWGYENESLVTEGESTTAVDGTFAVTFTPEPDSNEELSTKPTFEFEVEATVTDLNGESHLDIIRLRVGFNNAFLALEEGSTPGDIKVKHFDINGNPLPGKVQQKVELLRQPEVPLLDSPLMTDEVHPMMDENRFRAQFPLFAYSEKYNSKDNWPVDYEGWKGESGVYRVTLTADDADTVTEYLTYVAPEASKVPSQQLLWAETDKSKAEVGQTVHLRFGTRFEGVEVYYLLRIGNEEQAFRRMRLSDEMRSIDIPVSNDMLGGFQIDLVAVREGVEILWHQSIEVPFSHKQQKVVINTFRDKLLPGETEEWTIRVEGDGSQSSALILTMYDDALNSYGSSEPWIFSPWRTNWSTGLSTRRLGGGEAHWMINSPQLYYQGGYPSVWHLKEALPYYHRWYARPMYKSARASNRVMYDAVEEEQMVMTELSVVEDAAPMMANAVTGATEEVVLDAENRGRQEPQLRSNLNTLAFFAPTLRTDADGTVTYRFTVPDLLTRWNVRGLAVTTDIKMGTLDKTLITQKPLMVQPNLPRFLRSGDSLSLMAKVVLAESAEEPQEVEVSLLLADAATGDTLCQHSEHVMLMDAAQVMFDVEVPQNVYVATYKIVASADGMSDGEQGQLPVVSNRTAVTISQAMYINGVGEKHYFMPEWLAAHDTRQPLLVGAEVTTNPIWLAIKSMPYLQECENPSTLYLANQLYVNTLGGRLAERDDVRSYLSALEKEVAGESRLRMNEDVKQTLLQATPWVRDMHDEEAQMAAVKRYFDRDALHTQLTSLATQLKERQNADGGWSWMPEGKSSLWITQQVLKRVVSSQWSVVSEKALAFVDQEQQEYFDRYVKPYLQKGYRWQPTDVDYLYTRSSYGKANTEAYKCYYSNALKNYRQYESLYTQAQLALIFHRHGDHWAAIDLLRRIKEKALENDEMGMYWRDNVSGWFWYQRPIATQALLINAFAEIVPDDRESLGLMQQWLLKQKQTNHWGNDVATTDAINALMCGQRSGATLERGAGSVNLSLFGCNNVFEEARLSQTNFEGYLQQRWMDDALDGLRAHGSDAITLSKNSDGIAWGAVYYQFSDEMDMLPSSDMGIRVRRSYQLLGSNTEGRAPRVGDRIKVRIDIQCDRTMEYLELIDGRPACTEPLSTRAGWRWNEGLSYYIVVGNTDTRCYIDRLEKGKYWFEYELFVTNPGRFMSGPVIMQCMYAPEFRAIEKAIQIDVMQ